jgi:amidase
MDETTMNDPAFMSATDLLAALRAGQLSSRELLEQYLVRIERHNGTLGALVALQAEEATQAAVAADEARARGLELGALHGLPMTVADSFDPAADEPIRRLVDAGAIVFGRTNVEAPPFGSARSPWDRTRSPGDGSAAALAAGLTALELGSDAAGSVRRSAHNTGTYALKPSHGVVPQGDRASMAQVAPRGRCVDDLELSLGVLAGPDEAHSIAWELQLPEPRAAWLGDYRVAVCLDDPSCPVVSDVAAVLRRAVDALSDGAVHVTETPPPVPLADAARVHSALLLGEHSSEVHDGAFAALKHLAATTPPADDEPDGLRQARLLTQTKRDWNAANEERAAMRHRFAEFFLEYDAFLCPVASTVAPVHHHEEEPSETPEQDPWLAYASAAYLPALSLPAGLSGAGLPVGLQVVGPYLEDLTAIDVGRRIAAVLGGFEAPPAFRDSLARAV